MAYLAHLYRENELKSTTFTFLMATVLYWLLAGDLISGRNYFTGKSDNVALLMLAGEALFCACFVLFGVLTRRNNRRLIESGLAEQPNYIFFPRIWNNLAAILVIAAGLYFFVVARAEMQDGFATGGMLFQNHRIASEPESFWQLIYFHFALAAAPIVGGIVLMLFPPKRMDPIGAIKSK